MRYHTSNEYFPDTDGRSGFSVNRYELREGTNIALQHMEFYPDNNTPHTSTDVFAFDDTEVIEVRVSTSLDTSVAMSFVLRATDEDAPVKRHNVTVFLPPGALPHIFDAAVQARNDERRLAQS